MASSSRQFAQRYNPEDPEDAQKLLAMLDDRELDEGCERVLKDLEENSDIEYCSDDDDEEDIPLEVLSEKIRLGADKLPQNEEKAITQAMDVEALVESTEQFVEDEEAEIPDNYLGFDLTCTSKENINWSKNKFHPNIRDNANISVSETLETLENHEVLPPIEYFLRYIPEHLFLTMAEMMNIYALQQNNTNFKQTNSNEIKVFVGLHLLMSCLKFPRIRMYWDREFKMQIFSDNMARNRFFQLRTTLHIVNNLEKPNDCSDKLYKVRPLYDSLKNRCYQLKMEKNLSIDEQMVPFRGQLSIKQYVKGKPNPWGIKIFMLCGKSGMMHDFIIYQGKTTELDPQILKKFGLGASVIIHLSKF